MAIVYSRARQPIVICLLVFGIGLFVICGYLIYLTLHEHAKLNDNVQHTCNLVGNPLDIFTDSSNHQVVMVSEYTVAINTDNDSLFGVTGQCFIESPCTHYHYSYYDIVCDTYVLPPKTITCWTTKSDKTPVCSEPGSNWVSAMVGAIITGVIGFIMVICVVCLKRDIQRRPSVTDDTIEAFVAMPGTVVYVVPATAKTSPPVVPATAQVVSQPIPKSNEDHNAKPYVV